VSPSPAQATQIHQLLRSRPSWRTVSVQRGVVRPTTVRLANGAGMPKLMVPMTLDRGNIILMSISMMLQFELMRILRKKGEIRDLAFQNLGIFWDFTATDSYLLFPSLLTLNPKSQAPNRISINTKSQRLNRE
jgi:hypothetical protein